MCWQMVRMDICMTINVNMVVSTLDVDMAAQLNDRDLSDKISRSIPDCMNIILVFVQGM
jgi:hypothetical protein